MFNIQFTHTSNNSSSAKQFTFGLNDDDTITEKVPPQAQHIIELIYNLAQEQETFTYNDIIAYIDECCAYNGTVFTRSKGGTERIVRYYGKLLQELNVLVSPTSEDVE